MSNGAIRFKAAASAKGIKVMAQNHATTALPLNKALKKCKGALWVSNTITPSLTMVGIKISNPKILAQNGISSGCIVSDNFLTITHIMLSKAEKAAA